MSLTLAVVITHPNGKLPTRATERAQCIDFYAAEEAVIYPGDTVTVDLGIKVILPTGFALEFRERSGLATAGIIIGAGVIDEDYHGPLKAVVRYMHQEEYQPFVINVGDRIVQGELVKRIPFDVLEIDQAVLDEVIERSQRGELGFGSTGV